jgi:plasmid stability protein
MVAIHIRSVPLDVHRALRRRAEANHRSMQQELLVILEQAAQDVPVAAERPPLRLHVGRGRGDASDSREEIYGDDGR